MLALPSLALAADMSWTCAPLEATEDGQAYIDASVDAGDTALDLALSWMTCATEACVDPDPFSTDCVVANCTTDEGTTIVYRDETTADYYDADWHRERTITLSVDPLTEAWSALSVEYVRQWNGYGDTKRWSASWSGRFVEGWPSDRGFSAETGGYAGRDLTKYATWADADCFWRSEFADYGSAYYDITVGSRSEDIAVGEETCASGFSDYPEAWMDGAFVGRVDGLTWQLLYIDADGDGCTSDDDCNDADAAISYDAREITNDGIDQDCDGVDRVDADGDGFGVGDERILDCDDSDASVFPGAPEIPYDGRDQDCDGADANDLDDDGFVASEVGGDDCDDADDDIFPGATEVAYDGVDQDCSGEDLNDQDGDGADAGPDCNDFDAEISPNAIDVPYDGIDQDCDDRDLTDVDGDGFAGSAVHGLDCDDSDATISPAAPDVWDDGIDQDCDGVDASGPDPECGCAAGARCAAGAHGAAVWSLGLAIASSFRRRRRC